jgi:hypothetical protein
MLSSGVSEDSYSVHTYNKLKKKKKRKKFKIILGNLLSLSQIYETLSPKRRGGGW